MSTNVSSMKSPRAMFQVYQALEHSSADIIFPQETRLGSSVDLRRASREWHCGPSFFSIAPEPGASYFGDIQGSRCIVSWKLRQFHISGKGISIQKLESSMGINMAPWLTTTKKRDSRAEHQEEPPCHPQSLTGKVSTNHSGGVSYP
ncbi:hypothetical protein XENTR_v10004430 [Xenopus tropicalis]|nr:hypothetical protein XENTR_v10004430 [Xenopus tropicalis]